jgi:hypothetical protein
MGQIFHACVYDPNDMTCCVVYADKFRVHCYAHSEAVSATHYLLRQKAYHVMWAGDYAVQREDLFGLSDDIEQDEGLGEDDWYDKVKFIGYDNEPWKMMNVRDEASEYFDWENTSSVKYSGYLVNHTKRRAVDLADYHSRSRFLNREGEFMAIDLVPVLTETGGGTARALADGLSADSTAKLSGAWCRNLLQIVDALPEDYVLIRCCFAEIWSRAHYCYRTFGVDKENYLWGGSDGDRFKGTVLKRGKERSLLYYIKIELTDNHIKYIPIPVEGSRLCGTLKSYSESR